MPPVTTSASATATPQAAANMLKSAADAPAFVETTVTTSSATMEMGSSMPQGEMINVLMKRSVPQLKAIAGQQQGFPTAIAHRLLAAGAAVLPLGRVVSASSMIRK